MDHGDEEMFVDCASESPQAPVATTQSHRKDRKAKKIASQNLELMNNFYESDGMSENDYSFVVQDENDARHETKRLAERKRLLICRKLGVKKLGDLVESKSLTKMAKELPIPDDPSAVKQEVLDGTRGIPTKEKVGYRCVPYETASTAELACLRIDLASVDADLRYLENFLEEYPKKSMNQLQECKSAAFSKAHQKLAMSTEEDVLKEELMLLPKDLSSILKNETLNACKDEELKDFGIIKPMMDKAPSAVISPPFMSPRSELTSPAFMSPRSQFLSPSQSEMSRQQTHSELRSASRITSPKSSEFMSASSEAHLTQDKD
ncbi:unnamed protein product, partial [Mesorhabditis belari]|uniref:Uncharacterized protein n=1 Tax=Mesorhabditis belari TaxID=2138241 RepID=A0AAF3EFM1_9BILA